MKQAINAYEQLKDAFDYTLRSWLRLDLTRKGRDESREIIGAACFLFDNLYAKEDAGKDITKAVAEDLGKRFDPKKLMEMATDMRVFMSGDDFSRGKSPLRDYVKFVEQTEESCRYIHLDNAGKLVYVYSDMLTNLVVEEHSEVHPMRIAELIFLTSTEEFGRLFRETLHEAFPALASSPYFLGVEEAMERIRKENVD